MRFRWPPDRRRARRRCQGGPPGEADGLEQPVAGGHDAVQVRLEPGHQPLPIEGVPVSRGQGRIVARIFSTVRPVVFCGVQRPSGRDIVVIHLVPSFRALVM